MTATSPDDRQVLANTQFQQAHTIGALVVAGFTPASARDAVVENDLTRLVCKTADGNS